MAARHGIRLVYVNPQECADQFAALMELTGGRGYDDVCHYTSTHIMGTTGGNTEDLKEAIRLAAQGRIRPAVMVTHIGGIDAIAETTARLPQIPGGKKLTYTQFDMPLTAIEDFREKGRTDPLFARLADSCEAHDGLWNAEAEKILFWHFGVK